MLQTYFARVDVIVDELGRMDGRQIGGVDEAQGMLARLRLLQGELQQIKREIDIEERELRSQYSTAKTEVGTGTAPLLGGLLFGRKAVGKTNALNRDAIRQREHAQLAPYEKLKSIIDNLILEIDRVKLSLEQWGRDRASQIAELQRQIAVSEENIKRMTREAESKKPVLICPSCNTPYSVGQRFCSNCACPLESPSS